MAEALPKRPKKTSAEKRNCRSAASKWRAQTGEAKVARTRQWAATNPEVNFLRFMHYHNVEWKDLHGILVSYFQQELRYDIMETAAFLRPSPDEEPGLRDFLRASSAEEVQVDVPPELSLPVAIDISVFLQAPTAVDSQDGAAQLVTGGDTEVQLGSLTRDVEALLRDALPFSAHEWLLHLEGLTSDDVPFNVFGVNVSRFHYNQSGLNPPTAASSSAATSASELRHLGIWGDGDGVGCQPVGSSDDASSSSEVGALSPAILFEHRPNRPDPSGQSLAQIQRMRKPSYFDEEGFRWAEGLGKNSSGARVRKRYAQAGYWLANPAEPSLEELKKFTDSRFPNSPVDDVSTEAMASAPDALAKGFGKGQLYRMLVCDAPANCNRHWHGSNDEDTSSDADDDEDTSSDADDDEGPPVHSLSPAPPRSHYEVLEIDWHASMQEVRAAYKRQALRSHPDKPSGSTAAFQLVSQAFAVLSEWASRDAYDVSVRLST